MTRAMRGWVQESVSGGMGYRGTFVRMWVVHSVCHVVVVLVRDLEREGRRWHRLGNIIFGRTRPSRMSVGSTSLSFRPTVISWRELRLTLVALSCSRRGSHLDIRYRSSGRKPMYCPGSFGGT